MGMKDTNQEPNQEFDSDWERQERYLDLLERFALLGVIVGIIVLIVFMILTA